MEIQELILKHYGKFDNHRIRLKPGINIIYGGNEVGKSTIHSFIRSMLFGLNRARGRGAAKDEYQIRQPWDSPGAFLGSMRICEQGEVYRIDRCFDRSTQPLQVVCETSGQEAEDPEAVLSQLLGGISEASFVNTVFISQAQCETDEALSQELRRFMVNSENALDAETDVTQALQILRKKKKQYEQKKKKEDEELEKEIAGIQKKAESVRTELELLKRQREEQQRRNLPPKGRQTIELWDFSHSSEETEEESETSQKGWVLLEILLLLAGLLALAGAFWLQEWTLKLFLAIFGGLFLLLMIPVHFLKPGKDSAEQDQLPPGREDTGESALDDEIRSREELYASLQDELEALYSTHVSSAGTETEIAALTMAIDRICELTTGICAQSGQALNDRASEILNEITGGRYRRIALDETMDVRIHTPSRVLGLHQVSGGTMQQIYFALRMAAGELLSEGHTLPVILDETFAMYDDERLEAVLRWLRKSGRQVILFTCQRREREIMQRL